PGVRADSELRQPPDLVQRLHQDEPVLGRTRPLYWLIRSAQIAVFGEHPDRWHAFYLLLGITTAVLLYSTLRQVGCHPLPSACAAAWLLVAPGVQSVWIRLGPQESLGTFCLVLSLFSASRAARGESRLWDVSFVVAMTAAVLMKESFSLAAPAGV